MIHKKVKPKPDDMIGEKRVYKSASDDDDDSEGADMKSKIRPA